MVEKLEEFLKDLRGSDTVKVVLTGVGEVGYRSEDVFNAIMDEMAAVKNTVMGSGKNE